MHLADAFIQSDLQCIQAIHLYCQYVFSISIHNMSIDELEDYPWILLMFFINCLDSHSDGTHSLQRMMSKWWNATFVLSCSDEETNSSTSWMVLVWVHFQQIFQQIWGRTIIYKLCLYEERKGAGISITCNNAHFLLEKVLIFCLWNMALLRVMTHAQCWLHKAIVQKPVMVTIAPTLDYS